MRVLYVDSLFFMELTADTLLLWAAGKLCGAKRKALRLLAAGLFGGAYALTALFWPPAGGWAGRAASLAGMLLIAYGREQGLWKTGLAFLFLCAVFGGVMTAVTLAAGKATARALLFSAGVSLGVCALPFRFSGRRGGTCRLRLVTACGEAELTALRDTGDRLVDPFTGRPVVIASEQALLPLFSEETRAALAATAGLPPEERLPLLGTGFCLIPLETVSGRGLALCTSVAEVYSEGEPLGCCRAVVSRTELRGGCEALISGDIP